MKRTDERDIVFARMHYKPGTPQYRDYYGKHPEKKDIDDELRSRTELYSKETPTYDNILSPAADSNFAFLSDLRQFCDGEPAVEKTKIDSSEITVVIKNIIRHYGALDVGITYADDEFFYTHRGRLPENYGDEVNTKLRNAIVFLVRMKKEVINTAPAVSGSVETSKAYVDAAFIGLQIAYFIRGLGYNARCHMDGNYLLRAMPLAAKAGLGEQGRNGLLISRESGSFVRIGIVTTDMELEYDEASDLGIERFCRLCGLCIKTCPGKTIPESNNIEDWHVDQEKCYGVWRNIGTDCGICISSCPVGQEISAGDIAGMSDDEIKKFIAEYKENHGSRKRIQGKYFL